MPFTPQNIITLDNEIESYDKGLKALKDLKTELFG